MHFTREQRDAWIESTRDSPFNTWLKQRIVDDGGGLNIEALYAVAAEYGVDGSAYRHLNPGQQRMNIGNRLRKCVPAAVYMSSADDVSNSAVPDDRREGPIPPESSDLYTALRLSPDASDRDLMRLYAAVLDELRARKVVRTGNGPLGDYAEHLFAKAFGWTLEGNSASGHDAIDSLGRRIQIKARRLRSNAPGERQLSVIRGLPDAKFDLLAAVLFDRYFGVVRAALVPHRVVMKRSAYIAHVNGWRLILDNAVWHEPGVQDVTLALAAV